MKVDESLRVMCVGLHFLRWYLHAAQARLFTRTASVAEEDGAVSMTAEEDGAGGGGIRCTSLVSPQRSAEVGSFSRVFADERMARGERLKNALRLQDSWSVRSGKQTDIDRSSIGIEWSIQNEARSRSSIA